jgi:hypothetical protein
MSSEPADAIGRRWGAPRSVGPRGRMEWKQTGCCCDAQADGVPCDAIDCACENCPRSELILPGRASRRPRPASR